MENTNFFHKKITTPELKTDLFERSRFPFLWYGGRVRIQATLFPSGDSFSLEKYPTI